MSKQLPMAKDGKYQPNPTIVAWWENNNLTMAKIAKRSGFHEGTISKYLAGTYPTDVTEIERSLLDIIDSDSRKQTWSDFYFDTEVTETTIAMLDLIRSSCDIGLLTGAAGLGKTKGGRRYSIQNKTAILIELSEGLGDNYSIIRKLFDSMDIRSFKKEKGGITRGEFLTKRLVNSERIIIIDNAQRATLSGLRWLFDLHDAAGVPIGLIGNPELLDRIAGSDQLYSRVGIRVDVGGFGKINMDWLDVAAQKMLENMWPGYPTELLIIAQETARQPGHLRRLVKQIRAGIRLSQSPRWKSKPAAAFIEARSLIGKPDEE
jgi:DNA transposition AAA+ family ATPase